MRTNKAIILALIAVCMSFSQGITAQENGWREYVQNLAEDEVGDAQIEVMYDELSALEQNPYNLNNVTREELARFPLLSEDQANALSDFLQKNRPIYTVYELRNVPRLDYNTVALILPFFYVGEAASQKKVTLRQMLQYGKNELQLRGDKMLEKRAGYGNFTDSILQRYPNRKYAGEDFYHSVRYSFAYRDRIQAGIVAEKDAGEPFWKEGYSKGYDHYGFHAIVRDMGVLKTLALGDYRLSFGQGLVLNNDFATPKSWASAHLIRRTIEPKRHFSTAESGFFRGVASVVQLKKFYLTTFYSFLYRDAHLSKENEITSFSTDGYHRTPLEISGKNNVKEQVTGANLNYRDKNFQMGVSGIYYSFSHPVNPRNEAYNAYSFRGDDNANLGADYSYRYRRFLIGGEVALSSNGAWATLHSLSFRPQNPHFGNLSLSYRYYDKRYQALYAQPFGESGSQNETAVFFATTLYPTPKLSVTTYVDFIRYPYLRYGVDEPSRAIDFCTAWRYSFSKYSCFDFRYKLKQKEKNAKYPDERMTVVLPYVTHKLRGQYILQTQTGWEFRTIADWAIYQVQYFKRENGWMFSENVGYRGAGKWRCDAFVGVFKADTYATRLYSYERNIFNTFYMPSFSGKGARWALSARYDIQSRLSLALKIAQTRYWDRDVIGSGTEQINANHRTDVFTYLRWTF